jgi:hypothetical protein
VLLGANIPRASRRVVGITASCRPSNVEQATQEKSRESEAGSRLASCSIRTSSRASPKPCGASPRAYPMAR